MMKCPTCGRETEPNGAGCQHCRELEGQVKVLSPDERESFQGVTLDDGPTEEERRYQYESGGPRQRVYVRHVAFGGKSSLLTKILILAVIGVVVFFILPMFLLFFAVAALVWFILGLLRR